MTKSEVLLPNKEKLVLAGQGLEFRPDDESRLIVSWINKSGGDDPAKLSRRLLYEIGGKVWGESLFVAKKGELPNFEQVVSAIGRILITDGRRFAHEVAENCLGSVVNYSHDVILYLVMARDVGGDAAAEELGRFLCWAGWTKDALKAEEEAARPYYLATAGKNVWEWEDAQILRSLPGIYFLWQKGLAKFPGIIDEIHKRSMETSLSDMRRRLTDFSQVLIKRGAVNKDLVISDGKISLDFDTLTQLAYYL